MTLAPVQRDSPFAPVTPSLFRLVADFEPAGDQPGAIRELVDGLVAGERDQVRLGVTGSGKS